MLLLSNYKHKYLNYPKIKTCQPFYISRTIHNYDYLHYLEKEGLSSHSFNINPITVITLNPKIEQP